MYMYIFVLHTCTSTDCVPTCSLSSLSTDASDGRGHYASRDSGVNTSSKASSLASQSSYGAGKQTFPAPTPAATADDFPRMSQRRKFLSDYVSREDYFSHHPPPPNYAAQQQQKKKSPPHANYTSVSVKPPQPLPPSLPPKPAVQPKPRLKHSLSTDKPTKVYPEIDESGGINIYATLPRRPKNRERSSTLSGQQQADAYNAYLTSQQQQQQQQQRGFDDVDSGRQPVNAYQPYENLPPVSAGYGGSQYNASAEATDYRSHVYTPSNHVSPARHGSRDDVSRGDYIPRMNGDADVHNLSIESMVTQQIQNLTLTRPDSGGGGVKTSRAQAAANHSQPPQKQSGPHIQRLLPQQTVSGAGGSPLPVYPHPPLYQGSGAPRQNSLDSQSSSCESNASQMSKLEAHQMALMHQRGGNVPPG